MTLCETYTPKRLSSRTLAEFYRICDQRGLRPGDELAAFIRKTVQEHRLAQIKKEVEP